jgi:hypothetical protein
MTGAGVTLYLVLAMHNYVLAALAAGLFAPLIVFHFIVTLISKRDGLVKIEGIQRTNENLEREKVIQRTWEALTEFQLMQLS